ncbi:MAG: aminotransferase class I/II-fold pyridoxal phosphate-dependent enzyme, partial [Ruminococcus sp.]
FRVLQCLHPKRALLPVPSFLEYETALQEIGCSVIHWQMSPNLTITHSILLELQTRQYDCLMLCNPNNPTGTLLQKSQLIPILDCCLQNGIRVILDECFCDMTSEAQQASLLASCTAYPNVFFLKSLTKRFAIPGLRLGYGVCADVAFIEKVRQTGQPWSVNTLAAAAGIAALQDAAYQQQFQTFLEQEQPAFYHALQAIPTLQVWKPAANFVFFRTACTDLQERLLHRHILIRHCENYVGLDATYYRTAIRSHAENQILLQALQACL